MTEGQNVVLDVHIGARIEGVKSARQAGRESLEIAAPRRRFAGRMLMAVAGAKPHSVCGTKFGEGPISARAGIAVSQSIWAIVEKPGGGRRGGAVGSRASAFWSGREGSP